MEQQKPELMTIQEVTEYLRISRQYLHILTKEKKLPSYKLGRRRLYKREDIEIFLQEQQEE